MTVAPHGHFYFINGDEAKLTITYLPTLIEKAPLENIIVLRWTNLGPFDLVTDVNQIKAAENPTPSAYLPKNNITSAPSDIVKNRFFHGRAGNSN